MRHLWDLARLDYAPMQLTDLIDVLALEESVYPHPWSMANFVDSLNSQYEAWVVRDNGDHDIDCKVDGFGAMYLKSSVVRKV